LKVIMHTMTSGRGFTIGRRCHTVAQRRDESENQIEATSAPTDAIVLSRPNALERCRARHRFESDSAYQCNPSTVAFMPGGWT